MFFRLRTFFILLALAIFSPIIAQNVVVLNLDGPIYPSTAVYIEDGLNQAIVENAVCVVLKINTPGGLLEPSRQIVGQIINADIPIISYVAPAGAHAGSAGAFIALSANISAMAPGSNIGAAHPIIAGQVSDSVMNSKLTEDAGAFMRSIAEHRGRDTTLILQMVTLSRSFSADQALQNQIIDLKANSVYDLLQAIDGRTVQLASGKSVVLNTATAKIKTIEMGSKQKFLTFLSNPNFMYVFLLMGMMGLFFELSNPGGFAPGIIGIICLILAGFGMSVLPIDYTGLALIIVAIILFVLEIKFQSYALLSFGGVICLFLGSVFLIDENSADMVHISWSVLITSVVITSAFFILLIYLGLKAQMGKRKTGIESLIGMRGIAMENIAPDGRVRVNGEFWNALAENEYIEAKNEVEVLAIKDFTLIVKGIT